MLSRTQKLDALKDFLEIQAFSRVDGHDAHDGFGCKGHDDAFVAKAEELLALIEDNYGYEPLLVEAWHKPWGGGRKTAASEKFMNRLTDEQFEAFKRLNPGETFSLLVYDDGTTTFEINPDAKARVRADEIREQLRGA